MKTVVIASGKGGTGKTSLAISLLLANRERSRLLDCDVEEPNCHLFISAREIQSQTVNMLVPKIDANLCRVCGRCVGDCQFHALALAGRAGILLIDELCHGCGGCVRACPYDAITEEAKPIGQVHTLITDDGVELVMGKMMVGRASAPSIIRAVKKHKKVQRCVIQLSTLLRGRLVIL